MVPHNFEDLKGIIKEHNGAVGLGKREALGFLVLKCDTTSIVFVLVKYRHMERGLNRGHEVK